MSTFDPDLGVGMGAAISAARNTGLLEALTKGEWTADALAERCETDPRTTRLVLEVLAAMGLVARQGERYAASERFSPLLLLESPWAHLPEMLRSGRALPMIDEHAARGPNYRRAVLALGRRMAAPARRLAERLGPARKILDVGAGSGIWSLSMAERDPLAVVVALDLPEVVSEFEQQARAMGLADRARAIPGDFHRDVPEGPMDRVILANVLHLETEGDAQEMVRRFGGVLAPGGELVIVEAIGEDASARALYALHLGLRTARGAAYGREAIEAWCRAAGLSRGERIPLDSELPGLGAFVAHRD